MLGPVSTRLGIEPGSPALRGAAEPATNVAEPQARAPAAERAGRDEPKDRTGAGGASRAEGDRVSLSPEARRGESRETPPGDAEAAGDQDAEATGDQDAEATGDQDAEAGRAIKDSDGKNDAGRAVQADARKGANGKVIDKEDRERIRKMSERDGEVRRHEAAHMAAGGPYAGSATYEFERGPDGRLYAVAGEVPVDASAVPGDPAQTIAKMQTIRRAALAPADPSSADRAVAAQATQTEQRARAEMTQQQGAKARAAGAGAMRSPGEGDAPAPTGASAPADHDSEEDGTTSAGNPQRPQSTAFDAGRWQRATLAYMRAQTASANR